MRHLSVPDHWARRHHKPDDSLDWCAVDRRLSPTDRAERQGERGAEQLLDGGAKRHPGPLPAPQGQDEQVQGRASQAPGRTHAGKCCRLAGRPRRAARRYCRYDPGRAGHNDNAPTLTADAAGYGTVSGMALAGGFSA